MIAIDTIPPLVSFVIPVRNDAERLRRCLQSIRANHFPEQQVEVIVVDNGSTDRSGDVARSGNATTLDASGCNVASLRNLGARRALGQILAFVDADHEIAETWLPSAVETLQRPGVTAVGASYTSPPQGTWVQRLYGALRGHTKGYGRVEWLGSGNLAIWREAFERVGGFDTSLETCEDVDLCLRLRRSGYELIGDERLRTVHYGDPATLKTLLYGEMWRGRDNLRVSLRGPLSWRGMPSLVIPIAHLALAGVAIGSLLLFREEWGVTILSGSLFLMAALTTLRAMRLLRTLGDWRPLSIAQAFAVAGTYDAGRAAALLARADHGRRRGPAEPRVAGA